MLLHLGAPGDLFLHFSHIFDKKFLLENSVDLVHMSHSDLGFHCLNMSSKQASDRKLDTFCLFSIKTFLPLP